MKRNIIVTASQGISIRNFFCETNKEFIFQLQKKYNVYFVTEKNFLEQYKYKYKINFIDIKSFKISKFEKIIYWILSLSFYKKFKTRTHFILLKKPIFPHKFDFLKYICYLLTPNSSFLLNIYSQLSLKIALKSHNNIKNLINDLNPLEIISLNPLAKKESIFIAFGNKYSSTSGVIKSFDNITSNGFMPFIPKKLFVWNSLMKEDASIAYKIIKKNIFCVGSSQYDFLSENNLNLKKTSRVIKNRKILYCTNSVEIYPGDHLNISFLLKYAKKFNYKLILRFHQCDTVARWLELPNSEYLEISNFEIFDNNNPDKRVSSKEHLNKLYEDIDESLLTISSYSTLIYDSIARSTPVINLGFDPKEAIKRYSIERFEQFEHIKPILRNEFVMNVKSQQEMIKKVSNILDNYDNFTESFMKSREKFINLFLKDNITDKTLNNIFKKLKLV